MENLCCQLPTRNHFKQTTTFHGIFYQLYITVMINNNGNFILAKPILKGNFNG